MCTLSDLTIFNRYALHGMLQLGYDTTVIQSVEVHHTVEESLPEMPVNPVQWDNTVGQLWAMLHL